MGIKRKNKNIIEIDAKIIGYDINEGFGIANDEYGIKYEYYYKDKKYISTGNYSSNFKNLCINDIQKIQINSEKPDKIISNNNNPYLLSTLTFAVIYMTLLALLNNPNTDKGNLVNFVLCFVVSYVVKDLLCNIVNLYKKRTVKLIKVEATTIDYIIKKRYDREVGTITDYYRIVKYYYNNKEYISKCLKKVSNNKHINERIIIEINSDNPTEIISGLIKYTFTKIFIDILCLIALIYFFII